MKNSWIKTELGEHIETLKGFAFKSKWYQKTGVAVVRVSDFTENSISTQALNYISDEIANSYCRYKIHHHDVIVQTVGSWQSNPASVVGKVIHVPYNMEGALLNQNAVKIIPKASITQRFLYYLLKANNFRQHNLNYAQGAANQASITLDTIKRFKLNLPPLPTQQKIASILSAYDDLIENNIRRIDLLEEQAQLIYEEWFVRMKFPNHENTKIDVETGLPEGWKYKTFADIVDVNPKTSIKKGVVAPFVPMGSISTSSMIIDPIEERAVSGGTKFKNGDTLFARITPCLENGKTGFVQFMKDYDSIATGSTEFIVLRETSSCGKYFIYCTSREEGFRENAIKSMVGSDGRQRVNTDCFEKYMVNFAPNEVRLKFEELCEPMFRSIQIFIEQNNKLREARDILLPRLMMGIIEV